jgi:hypothetical protein
MLKFDSKRREFRAALVAVVGAAAVCVASGPAQANWFSNFLNSGQNNSDEAPPDISNFLRPTYCPPVQIRVGTEALVIYERGHDGDESAIRFQASITKTARECHTDGGTMTIKIGIAGRLVAGPKGSAGSFTVPLRVAVVKQSTGKVMFAGMQKAPVSLSEPTFASDFAYVYDNVTFPITPDDHDLIVYVGYDQGKPKKPTPTG